MVLIDKIKGLSLKTKIILSSAIVVVIAAIVIICLLLNKGGYYATTMRLLRVEGTVNIEDANGNEKPVIDNIRFQSGDALNTGVDGLASVGLDDTKIVTLQNDSRAEFKKKNKKLELKLTKGALFFEVTEKLQDDEFFEIETSTMIVGIRGTSGYVFYDEEGRAAIIITDGKVHVVAQNPDTGEIKEADVEAGEKITVYTFNDRPTNTVDFKQEEIEASGLDAFALKMLAENEALLEKVCADTGWSKEEILALAADPYSFIKETDPSESSEESSDPSDPTDPPDPSDSSDPDPNDPSDPSDTPTPTPKPKKKPTPSPTPTPTPTPTPEPPSPTPSPTPEPPTPTPTPTPVPTPTNTPTPVPKPSQSESSESSESSEPEETEPSYPDPKLEDLPEGAEPRIWGDESGAPGIFIYISEDEEFYGYVKGEWVKMDLEEDSGGQRVGDDGTTIGPHINYVYPAGDERVIYYSDFNW